MSRTFRRKHAAQQMSNRGGKIAGVYTECDYTYTDHGHPVLWTYREPTKEERFKTFSMMHLDKGCYRFEGMKPWERRVEQKCDRARHRELIRRFIRGVTDDVVFEKLRKYPKWCW